MHGDENMMQKLIIPRFVFKKKEEKTLLPWKVFQMNFGWDWRTTSGQEWTLKLRLTSFWVETHLTNFSLLLSFIWEFWLFGLKLIKPAASVDKIKFWKCHDAASKAAFKGNTAVSCSLILGSLWTHQKTKSSSCLFWQQFQLHGFTQELMIKKINRYKLVSSRAWPLCPSSCLTPDKSSATEQHLWSYLFTIKLWKNNKNKLYSVWNTL